MIRILEKHVADKIAAGEVVERPASIIKELVENSIDANSSKITVEIKNGGRTYIRVTDNGIGIKKDEVSLAFLRHATSKIENEEDLDNILTLGFRGEALASIAAVSKVEIITKYIDEDSGSKTVLWGSEIQENRSFGSPQGTTIVVKDLFYNTPARLKFLKSDRSEAAAIIELISSIAMAYPQIKIMLINNDKILFSTNGKGRTIDAIRTITNAIDAEKLIEINRELENIEIFGYVSPPSFSKASRKEQIFFVNGRVVNSKVIDKALTLAYSDRLFEGRFPICYLFIKIDPKKLDVNIHPNKKEVKFHDDEMMVDVISKAIILGLNSQKAVTLVEEKSKINMEVIGSKDIEKNNGSFLIGKENLNVEYESLEKIISPVNQETTVEIETENRAFKDLDSNVFIKEFDILKDFEKSKKEEEMKAIALTEKQDDIFSRVVEESSKVFDFTKLQFVGQVFGTYIELKDNESIYFVDQHAAHERVFFESFLKSYESQAIDKQVIFSPYLIDISYKQKELEGIWLPIVERCGFTFEEFGPKAYRITEIPIFFDISQSETFIKDFFDTFEDSGDFNKKSIIDKIATKACKAAIKGNNQIDEKEIFALLKDMESCHNPYSCPHGRPTFIKIEKKEIEKRFKRV